LEPRPGDPSRLHVILCRVVTAGTVQAQCEQTCRLTRAPHSMCTLLRKRVYMKCVQYAESCFQIAFLLCPPHPHGAQVSSPCPNPLQSTPMNHSPAPGPLWRSLPYESQDCSGSTAGAVQSCTRPSTAVLAVRVSGLFRQYSSSSTVLHPALYSGPCRTSLRTVQAVQQQQYSPAPCPLQRSLPYESQDCSGSTAATV
jgi:hypothetical protein